MTPIQKTASSRTAAVTNIGAQLATRYAKELDLGTREFSYGKDADSMIQADRTGIKCGWKFTNDTGSDQVIYIAPLQVLSQTVDSSGKTVVPRLTTQANVVFAIGDQLVDGSDKFVITELESDITIQNFRGYACQAPLQITKMHLKSRGIVSHVATGADDSNYENPILVHWINPFYKNDPQKFQLRVLQDSRMNSPQFAIADFVGDSSFNALVSAEHVIELKVNARTELVVTPSIGAQDSRPQRFYRATRDANKVMRPLRKADPTM